MKILYAHDRFGAHAGAESNILHSAKGLQQRGHDVTIIHGPPTKAGEHAWKQVFPRHFSLPDSDRAKAVHSAIEIFNPDVIYLHSPIDSEVVSAIAESGPPVVRMVHDHQMFCPRGCRYPPWSRRPCTRKMTPYCVFPCGGALSHNPFSGGFKQHNGYRARKHEIALHKHFTRMVVASDYMRQELLRNEFNPARIEVHPPVPPDMGRDINPSFGSSNRIVYAGQLLRGKGVDVLLRSLSRVREPFECVILGDGNHRGFCESLSRRLNLADRVQFQGFVPQSTLVDYYREATLSVVSSVWPEPFGATGLEAMRCGLPVVAFDVGGIGEWLVDGTNGYMVPWMDSERYAIRVEQLLADKNLARRLGNQGKKMAADRFGFNRYIDGLVEMFSRVCNQHRKEVAV